LENQENNLTSLSMVELDDLSHQLLEKFLDVKNYTPKERRDIMQQYNKIAEVINKNAGFKRVIILTPSTRIVMKNTEAQVSKGDRVLIQPKKELFTPEVPVTKQIIILYKNGKTNKEIIAMGFNKSTVARQISEYKKQNK